MVERFNRSLLQLLRSYVDEESDWERYLPLVLYAYRTAIHSSTGVSPYVLMFGRQPQTNSFNASSAFDPASYQSQLNTKMAKLQDFVESKLASAASNQKCLYDKKCKQRSFNMNEPVWLSILTAGKLDSKWEGNWKVHAMKGPVNVEITDGNRMKVIHINRIQPRILSPLSTKTCIDSAENNRLSWNPPQIEHIIDYELEEQSVRRNPQRNRRPPEYYRPEARGRA